MVEQSHKGLIQREVTVKRGGKSFKQMRWVKGSEDEPEPKKSKKEDVKGGGKLGSFIIGQELSMLGNAVTIEKISEKEKTIKMSNGKVYTLSAVKKYSKPLAESKYDVGNKLIFNGEEKIVKNINRAQEVIEFTDGKFHTFDDIETFVKEPKKETKVKDLKPIEKKSEIKKEKVIKKIIPDKESKVIKKLTKNGLLNAKDRKLADKNLQDFVKKLSEEEDKQKIREFDKVSRGAKQYTAGSFVTMNAYLLANKKKVYDFETRGIKIPDKDEIEWHNKKIKILDEFLDKAPKVECTSYRGMYWNLDDPNSKKLYDNFILEMKTGNIIESKAYSSTTINKKILEHYGSARDSNDMTVKIEYETKSGVYIASESSSPEQQEVLLSHNMKFKVIKVIKDKNHTSIKLQEVD